MAECVDKNMIDKDEYPQTAELESRCVAMLSRLWHAPDAEAATGCSTTGSSEAAMLGGLALKRRWQQRRRAAGQPADRLNLVMGINVQVCWEKFANYWDVEMRLSRWRATASTLSAEEAVARCDENTTGQAVLGRPSTVPMSRCRRSARPWTPSRGADRPGRPGPCRRRLRGLRGPFVDLRDLRGTSPASVASINTSGHKAGWSTPGSAGWSA